MSDSIIPTERGAIEAKRDSKPPPSESEPGELEKQSSGKRREKKADGDDPYLVRLHASRVPTRIKYG